MELQSKVAPMAKGGRPDRASSKRLAPRGNTELLVMPIEPRSDGDCLRPLDQLEQANLSWKGYMDSMPSAGYTANFGDCTSSTGPDPDCTGLTSTGKSDTGTALYTRKHDPFMQYPDILSDPQRLANVVPLTQLTSDLKSGHVAQFVWISPNSCNDMHGWPPQCPFANAPGDTTLEALETRLAAQPTIDVPTIVLHGEADGVDPPVGSEHDARHFTARYERRVIPVAGHFLSRETPEPVVQAVRDLLT